MIKLQFSMSTEASSALIGRITHSPFSHVDIVMPEGTKYPDALLGASNSPNALVLDGNPNGVAIRPSNYQPFRHRNVAELTAPDNVETAFYNAALSQLGKPFDGAALHAFLDGAPHTGRDWREDDQWFCSELVTWSLEKAKWFPWPIIVSKDRIAPPDLLLLSNWGIANVDTFWKEL